MSHDINVKYFNHLNSTLLTGTITYARYYYLTLNCTLNRIPSLIKIVRGLWNSQFVRHAYVGYEWFPPVQPTHI